jgi:heme exporter protein D
LASGTSGPFSGESLPYTYIVWGAVVVAVIGWLLLQSARARRAQIRQMYEEVERERWRRELFGGVERPQELEMRVIHQLPAPKEPWQRKPYGIVILGVGVLLLGNLILLFIKPLLFPNAR